MTAAVPSLDPSEVAKFSAMAAEWWNPNGKFRPLHLMNPCRLDFITTQIAAEFGREDFQRDGSVEVGLPHFIDKAHASLPDEPKHFELRKRRAHLRE